MAQLHVEAEGTAKASPEGVWALVSDATRYPSWGPWSDGHYETAGEESPHGVGAVQVQPGPGGRAAANLGLGGGKARGLALVVRAGNGRGCGVRGGSGAAGLVAVATQSRYQAVNDLGVVTGIEKHRCTAQSTKVLLVETTQMIPRRHRGDGRKNLIDLRPHLLGVPV